MKSFIFRLIMHYEERGMRRVRRVGWRAKWRKEEGGKGRKEKGGKEEGGKEKGGMEEGGMEEGGMEEGGMEKRE